PREDDRVERNAALELRPRCYDGGNSVRLSACDDLRVRVQAVQVITALQKLAGDLTFATPDLKNRRPDRNMRLKKLKRFAGRHIDRSIYNKVVHLGLREMLCLNPKMQKL